MRAVCQFPSTSLRQISPDSFRGWLRLKSARDRCIVYTTAIISMSVHVNVRSFTDETVKPCPRAAAGRQRARAARPGAEELRPGRAGALAAAEGAGPGSPPGSRDGGGLGRPESSFLRISVIDGRRRDRIGRRRSTTPFESRSTPSRPQWRN